MVSSVVRTSNVIEIRFHEDLGSRAKNELRYRMELCQWRGRWRKAEEEQDHHVMEILDKAYDMIGLP